MTSLQIGFLVFSVFLILVGLVALIVVIPITRWYVMALMAKYDFVFTNVPESYFKEVVRFGGHRKTLLSKVGFKIDENGDIIDLKEGESPETSLPGGLRFVGLPFIDKIYRREMKFSKSLPSGDTKITVEHVDKFYAKVDYSYALPFAKCEDKNNLPLLGHATLLAHIANPTKSLFATANFYDTMIRLVLPSVRACLKGFTFDEIKDKDDLNEIIWAELNDPNPDGSKSVISELRDKYGIVIVALRIVNIDPQDEDLRKIGLTRYRAEREADAAEAIGKAEAKKAAGPIGFAMDEWIRSENEEAETMAETRARLRETGEYEKHKKLLADQINRSRKTVQERKVDITSGGEPLEGGSIASIAGTVTAAIIGAIAGKKIPDEDSSDRSSTGSPSKGGEENPGQMTPEELEEWAKQHKKGNKG